MCDIASMVSATLFGHTPEVWCTAMRHALTLPLEEDLETLLDNRSHLKKDHLIGDTETDQASYSIDDLQSHMQDMGVHLSDNDLKQLYQSSSSATEALNLHFAGTTAPDLTEFYGMVHQDKIFGLLEHAWAALTSAQREASWMRNFLQPILNGVGQRSSVLPPLCFKFVMPQSHPGATFANSVKRRVARPVVYQHLIRGRCI
jgi:hypothetical protein